jgi:hypothetical protein
MGGTQQTRNAAAIGHFGVKPNTELVASCINAPTEEMNTVLTEDLNLVNRATVPQMKKLAKKYRAKQTGKKADIAERIIQAIKAKHAKNIGTAHHAFNVSAERPATQLPTDEHYSSSREESKKAVEAILQLKQALNNLPTDGFTKIKAGILKAIKDNETAAYRNNEAYTQYINLVNLGALLDDQYSDATVWDLARHIQTQGRESKPLHGARKLPQYNNAKRIPAAVTTSYNYQKKGQQRKAKYWQPINLPILDILSMTYHLDTRGRQGYGTDAVKVARIEPRIGYINSDDCTRWEGRAKITPKSSIRTKGRIVRTIIEAGTDFENVMVWAFAPVPLGWNLDELDAWLLKQGMA